MIFVGVSATANTNKSEEIREERTVGSLIQSLHDEFLVLSKDSKLLNFYNNEEYLNDDNFISAIEIDRRSILYLTSVAWLFKDLNNLVWKYAETENDEYKELINYHCKEDGSHYLFHIHDFKKLGMNDINNVSPTDLLSFFFGELTERNRYTIYQFIYYDGIINGQNNPIGRYIIMQSLEICGHWFFESIVKNYQRYLKETRNNYPLRYLSNVHTNLELGSVHSTHDINGDNNADVIFGKVLLSNDEYNKYFQIGIKMMNHMINDLWDNEYKFITKKFNQQDYFNNLVNSF